MDDQMHRLALDTYSYGRN